MRRMIPKCLLVVGAIATGFISANAQAASCSFSSVIGVAFGTYDVFDPIARDSTGSITISCTGLLPPDLVTIELGFGLAPVGANRYMLNGTTALGYNLYVDAARTMIWGNGSNGTVTQGPLSIANDTPTAFTVYGRMPALQNVSTGNYADTITVTVQF